jgi:hypothetical protein
MTEKERAAQNLETIRSMMERATVYRMISGPTALFAGLLAVVLPWIVPLFEGMKLFSEWKWVWFGVAGTIIIFNSVLVIIKAKREGESIFSPGLRMGLRAILPAMVIGFVIGLLQPQNFHPVILAWIWMLCYGVALMATVSFAPRSLWWLGCAFVVAGLYHFRLWPSYGCGVEQGWTGIGDGLWVANMAMAKTFGIFHLIYGLYVIFIENKRS